MKSLTESILNEAKVKFKNVAKIKEAIGEYLENLDDFEEDYENVTLDFVLDDLKTFIENR